MQQPIKEPGTLPLPLQPDPEGHDLGALLREMADQDDAGLPQTQGATETPPLHEPPGMLFRIEPVPPQAGWLK